MNYVSVLMKHNANSAYNLSKNHPPEGGVNTNKMEKLKLEVGKTYRDRNGKKVTIVRKYDNGRLPYQGDNGVWYTKSGRCGVEDPEDLIEEVMIPDANQKHNETEVLILQIGRTYVNREGKEVKIVRAEYSKIWPFCGDNGKSYNEQGRCYSVNLDDSEDLIEEVPETQHTFFLATEALTATRYTFDIPEGVKRVTASQEGNRIVVEMMPEEAKEPKPGDVMVTDKGSVYIFKSVEGNHSHNHYAWLGGSGLLSIGGTCYPGHPATPEEAQPLWDALKKAGKRWNAETMEVEEIPEIDRIREWVWANLKSALYDKGSVAEAIEAYLKHKEGEK